LTGRYLVLCRETNDTGIPKALRDAAGLRIASSSDFPRGAIHAAGLGDADGIYFEALGVAVTSSAPRQLAPLMDAPGSGSILAVEPERVVYAFGAVPMSDHATLLIPACVPAHQARTRALHDIARVSDSSPLATPRDGVDESATTWGLVSTRVIESRAAGRGVRVAVLDTGFDLAHPDFAGRAVTSHSFVDGEDAQDGHSHGTHCIGTSLGCAQPPTRPRYGVAPEAEIFVGKGAQQRRTRRGWRHPRSRQLGHDERLPRRLDVARIGRAAGQTFSQVWETVAQRALAANTLIIAAAGNESDRPTVIKPVGHPANWFRRSWRLAPSTRTCRSPVSPRAALIRTAAGWTSLRLEWTSIRPCRVPGRYGRKNGTSMATPHVSGIAALWADARPNATARELWELLVTNAKRLDLDPADAGAGLVQAPV
jgi:subtilisin family serine protease